MASDNIALQADEVQALSAIYGDEWCVIDENHRVFCIEIVAGENKSGITWALKLQIHLPVDYPEKSPPQYQLNAPWLRGQDRIDLSNCLEEIYCENLGESIVYLWVEKIREFLQYKADSGDSLDPSSGAINVSEETDHGDPEDSFDPDYLDIPQAMAAAGNMDDDSDVQCPEISHGGNVTDRRSTFQAHLAPVTHTKQVKLVMDKLCENKKIANATHNIQAYRISSEHNGRQVFYHGCVDDGETHAGSRMLHLLQIVDACDVLVVVSRWYGGVHLGPDRFKHINNCTRQILLDNGYIKEKEDTKKGAKKKKGK